MSKKFGSPTIDGECGLCGYPGIIDMSCAECGGRIISIDDPRVAAISGEDNRYDKDELTTVSLDDLVAEELDENVDEDI